MLEVLFFSFSISIDAFGYSLGFGSRNIKLGVKDFLVLNIINILLLSLFLSIFPHIKILSESNFLEDIGSYLLLVFGFYYFILAYKDLIFELKNGLKAKDFTFKERFNYFNFTDFLILFSIFIIENIFSTFVFFASLSHVEIFVLLTFLFHCVFFVLGFKIGNKIISKVPIDTSFISGSIFILLAVANLM